MAKIDLTGVPEADQAQALALLDEYANLVAANPLNSFRPHAKQHEFLASRTPITAAFCGNRAGKTAVLVVKMLIELLPADLVPPHLLQYKQRHGPQYGWCLCPIEDKIFDTLLPTIDKWIPKAAFRYGNRAKAFNGERFQLTFANGSTLNFKTYKSDPSTLGGASLDFVAYDEPPPRSHYEECMTRLIDRDGQQWFAMTPLNTNVAWLRRDIWRKRESPDITVLKWGMRDNPHLDTVAIDRTMAAYSNDIWRSAREHGDFMDASGLVYAAFESAVVPPFDPPALHALRLDYVVGIDPGIRNAAIIFGGFDPHGVDWIFDEMLIQDGTPSQYVVSIDQVLRQWGLTRNRCMFVIDPAARQRSQATGDTVQSELMRLGIMTINGNNSKEAGQQQIRDRLLWRRLKVAANCVGLRDEADEFAWDMDDVEGTTGAADDAPYHRLATLRYQTMVRPFQAIRESEATDRSLGGYIPDRAVDMRKYRPPGPEVGPMGPIS